LRVQHRLEGASPSATPLLVPCMSKAVSAVAPWSRRRRVEPRGRPPSYRSESDTLYVRSKGVGNRRNKRGASGAGARLRGLAAIWRGPTVSRCALKGGLGTAPIVAESDPLTPVVDCDGLDEQGDDVDDLLGALDGVFTPGLDPRTRDVGDIDGLLVLLSLHDEMHESSGEHDGHEPADPDLPSPPV